MKQSKTKHFFLIIGAALVVNACNSTEPSAPPFDVNNQFINRFQKIQAFVERGGILESGGFPCEVTFYGDGTNNADGYTGTGVFTGYYFFRRNVVVRGTMQVCQKSDESVCQDIPFSTTPKGGFYNLPDEWLDVDGVAYDLKGNRKTNKFLISLGGQSEVRFYKDVSQSVERFANYDLEVKASTELLRLDPRTLKAQVAGQGGLYFTAVIPLGCRQSTSREVVLPVPSLHLEKR